jgi:hypothetical protein
MLHKIIERATTNSKAIPQEAEREVVAAISSAEGGANPFRGGGRAAGFGVPLLSLAAGAMVGYGAARWFLPWLLRQPAVAARPTFSARWDSIFGNRL